MQELFQIAGLVLKISIMMQVFAIGLGTTWQDATHLFRRPKLLVNSILARNVAMPIIAILLIKLLSLHGAMAITIAVLAITPVPPLLPKSQLKAGARSEYVLGLLISQTVLAVVLVPITVDLMDFALGANAHFIPMQVAILVIETILVPLAVGMLATYFMPNLRQIAHHVMAVGSILLLAGAIPLLILAWKVFGQLSGNGTMLALAIFIIAGMMVGHLWGGPKLEDRRTLAIATSARHPAIALAIAKANFPDQSITISGAIVIYLIFRIILSFPYMHMRKSPAVDKQRFEANPQKSTS
jgi:BASS family bile acid:Na+ symporter